MKNRISEKVRFTSGEISKFIFCPKGIRRAVAKTTLAIALIIVMAIAGVAVYLFQANSQPQKSQLQGTLNIAGSTLVFPLMNSWTFAYHQLYPGVTVNYNSIGSGGGIAQITARTVDIGATDAPLTSAQYSALPATVVTIPESISAVVPAYNLPGIKNGLKSQAMCLPEFFWAT